MRRPLPACLVVLILLGAACSGATGPSPRPAPTPRSPAQGGTGLSGPGGTGPPPPIVLDVVAATGPAPTEAAGPAGDDASYLAGMRLAVALTNRRGGVGGRPLSLTVHDDGGDPARATGIVAGLLGRRPPPTAVLFVGPGPALTPLRPAFAASRTPVVLLRGDLYTANGLFRQAFQTAVPWAWQVHVIARYLVTDRMAERVAFLGAGPEARGAETATRQALDYWGSRLADAVVEGSIGRDGLSPGTLQRLEAADAVVLFGTPSDSARALAALERGLANPPRVAGSSSLLDALPSGTPLPGGTTACWTYPWAGWAEPIPRVGAFVRAMRRSGRIDPIAPVGLAQEGFDAVRALATGLGRSDARGGDALVSGLESIHATFSGFPVDLGPDDHVFGPRDELGLFAVPASGERLDPWQAGGSAAGGTAAGGSAAWRPVMRTFTYDGTRTNVLDRDRRTFFPSWRPPQPGPEFWRSRYGIITGPGDPVH